jgi:precorrin-8X/cobalt-precorrin-8 methylmutase
MKIWPFELPLARLDEEALTGTRIVVAETYPQLVAKQIGASEIRDEAQVRTMAEWFAERDANGKLSQIFATEAKLTDAQKDAVTREEGWILGI